MWLRLGGGRRLYWRRREGREESGEGEDLEILDKCKQDIDRLEWGLWIAKRNSS
jgi:hypothetical protein